MNTRANATPSPRLADILTPEANSFGVLRFAMATLVLISHSYLYCAGTSEAEPLVGWLGRSLRRVRSSGVFHPERRDGGAKLADIVIEFGEPVQHQPLEFERPHVVEELQPQCHRLRSRAYSENFSGPDRLRADHSVCGWAARQSLSAHRLFREPRPLWLPGEDVDAFERFGIAARCL